VNDKEIVPYNKLEVEKKAAKQIRVDIEKFNVCVNREPEKDMILEHRDGFNYLPISHLETLLDEWFFGQWNTVDFKYQQICNEIIGDITLEATHPITGKTIRRIGAASVAIMQDKGAPLGDFTNTKKKTALVMGFPKLKAECFKNAVISLGKSFGRDLNRKVFDKYEPLIKPESNVDDLITDVIKKLDAYTGSDKETIRGICLEKKRNGEFTEEFAQNIMKQIKAK